MKLALVVILVLVISLVALILIVSRSVARMQHYQFAHNLLPNELFRDPDSVLMSLIGPNGRDFLLHLWEVAGETYGDGRVVTPDGLALTHEVFGHPNSTACFVHLPKPLKKPEAYFAAIVFDGPGWAVGTPRQLRYFVLEYHGEQNGIPRTLLGEWIRKGEGKLRYADHGSDTPPNVEAFVKRLGEIIESSQPPGG